MGKWIGVVIAIVLALRLWLAFSTPHLAFEGYEHARQVDHILATGLPLAYDELSWGGRQVVGTPVFDYLLAFFSLFMGSYALKIIPNLFASLSVIVVYLFAQMLTKKENVSLMAAGFAGFLPVFVQQTLLTASPLSLGVPLILFLCYALLRTKDKHWVTIYLITLLIASFFSPYILLFVFALAIYLALVMTENLESTRQELELVLFTIFFALWAQFVLYKDVLFFHGTNVFFNNLPLPFTVGGTSLLAALYLIGVVPFFAGILVMYQYFLKKKKKEIYLLTGIIITVAILVWLRFIPTTHGLVYLSLPFAILFADGFETVREWYKTTRLGEHVWLLYVVLVLVFYATSIQPAYGGALEGQPSAELREALDWIRTTPENSIVASQLQHGGWINTLGERGNVIDPHVLMVLRPTERYSAVQRLFQTSSQTEAVEIMDQYGATFVLTDQPLAYAPGKCFQERFTNQDFTIYEKSTLCRVREQ